VSFSSCYLYKLTCFKNNMCTVFYVWFCIYIKFRPMFKCWGLFYLYWLKVVCFIFVVWVWSTV